MFCGTQPLNPLPQEVDDSGRLLPNYEIWARNSNILTYALCSLTLGDSIRKEGLLLVKNNRFVEAILKSDINESGIE